MVPFPKQGKTGLSSISSGSKKSLLIHPKHLRFLEVDSVLIFVLKGLFWIILEIHIHTE